MLKKMLCCFFVIVFICSTASNGIVSFADSINEENQTQNGNEFVIVTKNDESLEILQDQYADNIEHSVTNNTIVLSLTDQEAYEVSLFDGTQLIEENIILKQSDENITELEDSNTNTPEEIFTENIKMVNANDINYQKNHIVKVGILDSGIADHDELNVSVRKCQKEFYNGFRN